MFRSINPYNQEIIAEFELEKKLDYKLDLAHTAFINWSKTTLEQRIGFLKRFAANLEKNKALYSETISLEMGKVLREAEAEIDKCIKTIFYYTKNAEELLEPKMVDSPYSKAYYRYEPLGAIFAIMPWNYPFWQVLRFAIPNLILGNTVLLKHAPNVLGSAKNIENAFLESEFLLGVFQSIIIDIPDVEKVISNPKVKGVTLTGSGNAGANVGALAGKYLKKSVLELGGSDPFIVLKDADIEQAIEFAVKARFQNAGQTCIAAKRWIVEKSVYKEFKSRILEEISNFSLGNQFDSQTTYGPVARLDLAEKLENQFKNLIKRGAKELKPWEKENCIISPQVLEVPKELSAAYKEELFGPVGLLIQAENELEAIEIANQTPFGLGASIWTKNVIKAEKLAAKIHAGSVFINAMVASDAALPFGGINISGYGRELGLFGLSEFSNIKSIALSK